MRRTLYTSTEHTSQIAEGWRLGISIIPGAGLFIPFRPDVFRCRYKRVKRFGGRTSLLMRIDVVMGGADFESTVAAQWKGWVDPKGTLHVDLWCCDAALAID